MGKFTNDKREELITVLESYGIPPQRQEVIMRIANKYAAAIQVEQLPRLERDSIILIVSDAHLGELDGFTQHLRQCLALLYPDFMAPIVRAPDDASVTVQTVARDSGAEREVTRRVGEDVEQCWRQCQKGC